jgi:hypothetical protein
MGRWPARGGLDVGSGCVEGAVAESGGGRRARRRRRQRRWGGVSRAARLSRTPASGEMREGEGSYDDKFKSVNFRRPGFDR